MSFPFLDEGNFESGATWTDGTTSDSADRIRFPHFSALANVPNLPAPYRGAYCMLINLAGSTTAAYILENTTFDMSLNENQFFRFQVFLSSDAIAANTNEFNIMTFHSASGVEIAVALNFTTANNWRLGVGETGGTNYQGFSLGAWHTVELDINLDAGTGNDGSIAWWLDGSPGATVSSLDQAAVTHARIGVQGQDAGTTAGTILFDEFYTDDARLYPIKNRWKQTMLMTSSGHAFVGPGTIENITLLSGSAADCIVEVWDTDTADTNDMENRVVILRNTATEEMVDPAGMPVDVIRGAYVTISGTASADGPFALLKLGQVSAFGSDGAVRTLGSRRKGEVLGTANQLP